MTRDPELSPGLPRDQLRKLADALQAVLDSPPHDTFEGRAGRTVIIHHREGCPGCRIRNTAREALNEALAAMKLKSVEDET